MSENLPFSDVPLVWSKQIAWRHAEATQGNSLSECR